MKKGIKPSCGNRGTARFRMITAVCLLLFALPLRGETVDSVSNVHIGAEKEYSFRPSQIVLPAALVAMGSIGVINGWPRKMSEDISNAISDNGRHKPIKIDDYLQYLPVAAYIGMGAVGVKCRHGIVERLFAGATAYAITAVVSSMTKLIVDRNRPFSEERNSFPSGHTATAFTGAELLRIEYGTGAAIGGYAAAICVAFLRVYNHRHWINDVIAGAGIGILSARIGYWMLPLYRKWFKLEKKSGEAVAFLPNITPGGGFGLSLAMTL